MGCHNFNVLVVEDDYFVRDEIVRILNESGHQAVGEAASGKEAVEKAIELNPDVILMDIEMPGMDGFEAAKQIQKQCPVPIVFLSAYDLNEMVETAVSVGGSGYLIKPPNPDEINRALLISAARHHDMMQIRELCEKQEAEILGLEAITSEIETLRGLVPICCFCKKIRDSKDAWHNVEKFIKNITGAQFTHGICPTCMKENYNISKPK